jgi:hypothetical protein
MSRLPFYYRDCQKRSSWGDFRVLLLFAIDQANEPLVEKFK